MAARGITERTYVRITLPDAPGISSGNGYGALSLGPTTQIEASRNEVHKLRQLAVYANLLADRLEADDA